MKKILIIFPTIYEANSSFSEFLNRPNPKVGDVYDIAEGSNGRIRALVSGFGCIAAEERIKREIQNMSPDMVILSGFCGACNAKLQNGERVRDILDEDKSDLLKKALAGYEFKKVRIATVSELAAETKKTELNNSGYDAVEMEADIIRNILKNRSDIEFVHLRWVSDAADCKIPMWFFEDMMDYKTGEMKMPKWSLFKMLILKPSGFGELKKFVKELAPTREEYGKEIVEIIKRLK